MRRLIDIGMYFAAFAAGCYFTYFMFNMLLMSAVAPDSKEDVSFVIHKGWSLQKVGEKLVEKNLLKNDLAFTILRHTREEELSKDGKFIIYPGEYILSAAMTPIELMRLFVKGDVVTHKFTVIPGMNTRDIKKLMVDTTLVNEAEARVSLEDDKLLASLRINSKSFEGYLAPETYTFSKPDNAKEMITRMVQEGSKQFSKEFYERAIDLGFSFHQILTLASIIEKETGHESERELISSVFHNRLRIGMPLQTDPTVIYGIKNFNGNLTKADLQRNTAYNTYKNTGLPPTPICSPSVAALKAALYPAETDYLYFVAKGDGTSYFSKTYREHRKAVRKYQIAPARIRAERSEPPAVTQGMEAPAP